MIHQPYTNDRAQKMVDRSGDDEPISPVSPPAAPPKPPTNGDDLPPPAKPPADYKPGDTYLPDGTKAARGNTAGLLAFAAIAAFILWME